MFANQTMHTVLPAADIERARLWYEEKLGLLPTEPGAYGGYLYTAGDSRFLLYQSDYAGTNQATAAGFYVDDFDAVIEALRSRGVEFEDVDFGEFGATVNGVISSEDGSMKGAWFRDSEGNIIAISTPQDS